MADIVGVRTFLVSLLGECREFHSRIKILTYRIPAGVDKICNPLQNAFNRIKILQLSDRSDQINTTAVEIGSLVKYAIDPI